MNTTPAESSLRFMFLEVHGNEAIQAATSALDRFLGGTLPQPAPAIPEAIAPQALAGPVEEAEPIVKPRKTRGKASPAYEKPADEPDGFGGPPPAPSTPKFVVDRKLKVKQQATEKSPGALASKIIQILDTTGGVSALAHLVANLGTSAHGINMAITKCDRLQRLPDGRIALTGYRDED